MIKNLIIVIMWLTTGIGIYIVQKVDSKNRWYKYYAITISTIFTFFRFLF